MPNPHSIPINGIRLIAEKEGIYIHHSVLHDMAGSQPTTSSSDGCYVSHHWCCTRCSHAAMLTDMTLGNIFVLDEILQHEVPHHQSQ
jgi:hypothetical protein